MNALDIILFSTIILFALFGKYGGLYIQINRFVSLIVSILITKIALYELIILLVPYMGFSNYIKPLIFYGSILCFYVLTKFIINIILFRFEPFKKNKILQSSFGTLFGGLNGTLILALIF